MTTKNKTKVNKNIHKEAMDVVSGSSGEEKIMTNDFSAMRKTVVADPEETEAAKKEFISKEDALKINDAKSKLTEATQAAQRASLEAKNAELEYKVTIQHIFLKYGLSVKDSINTDTCEITRSKDK